MHCVRNSKSRACNYIKGSRADRASEIYRRFHLLWSIKSPKLLLNQRWIFEVDARKGTTTTTRSLRFQRYRFSHSFVYLPSWSSSRSVLFLQKDTTWMQWDFYSATPFPSIRDSQGYFFRCSKQRNKENSSHTSISSEGERGKFWEMKRRRTNSMVIIAVAQNWKQHQFYFNHSTLRYKTQRLRSPIQLSRFYFFFVWE